MHIDPTSRRAGSPGLPWLPVGMPADGAEPPHWWGLPRPIGIRCGPGSVPHRFSALGAAAPLNKVDAPAAAGPAEDAARSEPGQDACPGPVFRIAVIGAGPRGLGLVERFSAILHGLDLSTADPRLRVELHVIEPNAPGQGVHTDAQPDHLLLNTAAGNISVWGDPVVGAQRHTPKGPSFLQWLRASGYRMAHGRAAKTMAGREIAATDILPRRLLGEYLSHCWDLLTASLNDHPRVSLLHRRACAVDLRRHGEQQLRIALSDGASVTADYAALCTGQNRLRPSEADQDLMQAAERGRSVNPLARFVWNPYPMAQFDAISCQATVAVRGMGLTAHDVVAQLTAGRGGRFERQADGRLRYRRCGQEPHIVLFSRRGFPFDVRALDQKTPGEAFQPRFLTREVVDRLRARNQAERGTPQLDFHEDVLPLIHREMCYAHYRSRCPGEASWTEPQAYVPGPIEQEAVDALLAEPSEPRFERHADYAAAVRAQMEQDLARAREGNLSNPAKAAASVLRDLIEMLRYAVDHSGLTPHSHERFFSEFFDPAVGQHGGAAPLERGEQLLALIEADVVRLGPGPAPQVCFDAGSGRFALHSSALEQAEILQADVVVRGQIDGSFPELDDSPFFASLLGQGLIRPYANGGIGLGGIDIDGRHHVLDAEGKPHPTLAALGFVAEGANFFTFVLPGSGIGERLGTEASQVASDMFAKLFRQHAQLPAGELTHRPPERVTPANVHPEKRRGRTVYIHRPTVKADFPDARALLIPGQPVPATLNGIAFAPWSLPATLQEWVARAGASQQVDAAVPLPFRFAENRYRTAGAVLWEPGAGGIPDIWCVVPTNAYGASLTLPQGRADDGEPLWIAILRELMEELGFAAQLDAVVGHYGSEYDPVPAALRLPGGDNVRYFLGHRIGGPGKAGYESQGGVLLSADRAMRLLPRPRDRRIVADAVAMLRNTELRFLAAGVSLPQSASSRAAAGSALPLQRALPRSLQPARSVADQSGLRARAETLRSLHVPGEPLLLANAWDAGSAQSIVQAGLPAVGTSSAAVARALGYPDAEGMPAGEMLATAQRIAAAVPVPVTVDMEAGYGLPAGELVERLLDAGAVGMNLEDTDHASGRLVEPQRQADWLAEVAAARDQAGVPLVLNARIDTYQVGRDQPPGQLLADTVDRAQRYLQAGADSVYPHLVTGGTTIAELVQAIPGPVNVLYWPGVPEPPQLAELGVARISLGRGLRRAADRATGSLAERFAQAGGLLVPAGRRAGIIAQPRAQQQLVLQGRGLEPAWVEEAIRLSEAAGPVERLAPGSLHDGGYRIMDVRHSAALIAWLEQARRRMPVDFFVGASLLLEELGLLFADVDGTLIDGDFQLAMADKKGVRARIDQMRLDHAAWIAEDPAAFEASMREQFGLLGMSEEDLQAVYRAIAPVPGQRRLLETLKANGTALAAATGGLDYVPRQLNRQYRLNFLRGNTAEIVAGHFTGHILGGYVDGQVKAATLEEVVELLALGRSRRPVLATVGDGPGEMPVMKAARGLAATQRVRAALNVAYRARPELERVADAALRHVGVDGVLGLFVPGRPSVRIGRPQAGWAGA
jgi:2-methylisocitrate lyase-like PEP mutase family enzyme/phosphoserine phosphatase/uncharacterized NAD(P)/FAD-binding protein YdhS/8-oxo-dGTP pyrophosphatase MutT (NUDIX family)